MITHTIQYYTALDIISSLGGIYAGITSVMGKVGFLFTFQFFWLFGGTVQRIAGHNIVKSDIQKNIKKLNTVLDKIENPDFLEAI